MKSIHIVLLIPLVIMMYDLLVSPETFVSDFLYYIQILVGCFVIFVIIQKLRKKPIF